MIHDLAYFGASETATPAVNSAALTASLGAQNCAVIPHTANGLNFGEYSHAVGNDQHVVGALGQPLVISSAPDQFLRLVGSERPSSVRGLRVSMPNAPLTGAAIRYGTNHSESHAGHPKFILDTSLSDIIFEDCAAAIDDEATAQGAIAHATWSRLLCRYNRGIPIRSRRSRGFMRLDQIDVVNTKHYREDVPLVTWPSVKIDDFIGVNMSRCTVTGQIWTKPPVFNGNVRSFDFNGAGDTPESGRFLWMDSCCSEGSLGHGFVVQNAEMLFPTNITAQANVGFGFLADTVEHIAGDNIWARGALGQLATVPGASGIYLNNVLRGTLSGCSAVFHTGAGVLLKNTNDVLMPSLRSQSNQGYGVEEVGTSDFNRITNSSIILNTLGNYTKVGANTVVN